MLIETLCHYIKSKHRRMKLQIVIILILTVHDTQTSMFMILSCVKIHYFWS